MHTLSRIFGTIMSALRSFFDVNGAASTWFWGYGGRRALDPKAQPGVGDRQFGNLTEEWMQRGKKRNATQEPE